MDVTLLFVAQSDDPSPILPENNELVWGVVGAGLLLVAVVIALVLVQVLVRYLIATRRIAERAASDAAALREELGQRQG